MSTYDFASDENPNKTRAREMLRMLRDINLHLKNIEPSGDKRVNMWCHTCHRGRPRPMTLAEELGEKYRMQGLKPALDLYADLKTRFASRGAYNFDETALDDLGHEALDKNDNASAVQILRLNAQQFPRSAIAFCSLGEAYMKSGDLRLAQENYKKALRLDPANPDAKSMLVKIKEVKGT